MVRDHPTIDENGAIFRAVACDNNGDSNMSNAGATSAEKDFVIIRVTKGLLGRQTLFCEGKSQPGRVIDPALGYPQAR